MKPKNLGYIKLSRKILKWQHWKEPSVLKVFLSLLLTCNSESRNFKDTQCNRGETFISVESLSKLCGVSKPTVYKALQALKSSGEIKRVRVNKIYVKTIITNYNLYQGSVNNFTQDSKNILPKQEYNNNTSSSLNINKEELKISKERAIASELLSSGIIIEQFCKNEHISLEQCHKLCDEVLNEWELTQPRHTSDSDIRRHLLSHIRVKIKSKRLVHEDKDKRLKKFIETCKKLISEGYPADDVREFYCYWVQPVNDDSGRMFFESVNAFDARTKFISYYNNSKRKFY